MNTRDLVDPALLAVADNFPAFALSNESLPATRSMIAGMLAEQELPDLPVDCREIHIPSGDGGRNIRCLLVRPSPQNSDAPDDENSAGAAAILHFHSGGHVMGQPEMDLIDLMHWAAELDALVLSVDYRLAPETPFPGPMDDAYAALRWLHEQASELGVDPARIAVAGSSAGGAMAACLCLMSRDRGEFPIAFQLLEGPRLDDTIQREGNGNQFTGEFIWTRDDNAFCWKAYIGNSTPSAYATAARAQDLTGLPPAFIGVGALDLFVDGCLDYSTRLLRSGVQIELIVYPGCFHGFQIAREADVARRSRADNLRALKKALNT